MPKEPTALASRIALLRRGLEILRVVWSDRRPCAARSHDPMPASQPHEDVTRTPASPTANEGAARAQPRRTIARALDHQAMPRRASERHDPLDRAPATTRPTAHPHARHEPLPHLGSRGLATRAVRRSARPVDRLQRLAPRAPPLPSFSPLFAAIRRPTANRGARIRTGDLADPNGARYQAAPRPDADRSIPHGRAGARRHRASSAASPRTRTPTPTRCTLAQCRALSPRRSPSWTAYWTRLASATTARTACRCRDVSESRR